MARCWIRIDPASLTVRSKIWKNVDARRASVGLEPLAEILKEHRRAVVAEGGRPREDFKAYKEAANQWAKQVGWR